MRSTITCIIAIGFLCINKPLSSAQGKGKSTVQKSADWKRLAMGKTFILPKRKGTRPKTSHGVPHAQRSQTSSKAMFTHLKRWLFSLPCVREKDSRNSFRSARGAWISRKCGRLHPISLGREFTHIHVTTGLGSMHLILPKRDAQEAVRKGWGEPHPWSQRMLGKRPYRLLMLYAPRNAADLKTMKTLIYRSYLLIRRKLRS